MVQNTHLAREINAQWDPLERKESRILNDVIVFFFVAPLPPILSGKAFLSHATVKLQRAHRRDRLAFV